MGLKEDINYSLWCDFIERDFLENRFKEIIKKRLFKVLLQTQLFLNHQLQTLLHTNNNLICYKQIVQKQSMKS